MTAGDRAPPPSTIPGWRLARAMIAEPLRPLARPVADFTLLPGNPRQGDVESVKRSLERFGQRKPIVVRDDGTVEAGNTTLRAALELGWDEIAAVAFGDDEATAKAFALADNRTSELGTFDLAALAVMAGDVHAADPELLEAASYSEDDLRRWLGGGPGTEGDDGTDPAPSLADRFLVPPFDILDSRQGWWRERKRRWLSLGIRSEEGRRRDGDGAGGEALTFEGWARRDPQYYAKKRVAEQQAGRTLTVPEFEAQFYQPPENALAGGTSVFDPVLCEVAYRWFSPPGGVVIDPFAGGSVRGITAAILGREYHGNDLSERQVAANRDQAATILAPAATDMMTVKVSAAQARQRFHGCEPGYIRDVCHGSCCRSSSAPGGILVTVHPSEQAAVEAAGATVTGGRMQPQDGRCPYQQHGSELCAVHETPAKPFGCIASPFTLNSAGTLIVRNRYRLLKCYKDDRDGPAPPAYVAFRASLDRIFGSETAAGLCAHLDAGGGDITLPVPAGTWRMLRDNDAAKHGTPAAAGPGTARWDAGDSAEWVTTLKPESADLIFTCPPYYDLETYSGNPADLSAMSTEAFNAAYAKILAGAARALRPDRFAVIITGDPRNSHGHLRDLRGATIRAAADAGLSYYSGAILITPYGSLPVVAARAFTGTRVLSRTHQDVLVFVKGDRKRAADACGPVEVHLPEDLAADLAGDQDSESAADFR